MMPIPPQEIQTRSQKVSITIKNLSERLKRAKSNFMEGWYEASPELTLNDAK